MRPSQQIVKRPLLTEKSARLRETGGAASARDANKIEIRRAIQDLFKVTVTQVNTVIVRGKAKRVGRFSGRRPAWKKAVVTLKPGDNIEFFEGV